MTLDPGTAASAGGEECHGTDAAPTADARAGAPDLPVVHVAMATYNGRRWIAQQVRSILGQEGVSVRLTVSDDGSTDGTVEWVRQLASRDHRVTLLPQRRGEPGLAANFLYAFAALDLAPGQYAAFADQDDVWRPGRLVDQIGLIRQTGAQAVSSNVFAFKVDEGGNVTKRLIKKDNPPVKWDFIFEAPGPGSTFLLTYDAWRLVVDDYREHGAAGVWLHDWYVYALARAAGMTWHIGAQPQNAYRQHGENALGEHRGAAAIAVRLRNLVSGLYREQFVLTAEAASRVGRQRGRDQAWLADLDDLTASLRDRSLASRMRIFARFPQIRRDRREGFALASACVLGVW